MAEVSLLRTPGNAGLPTSSLNFAFFLLVEAHFEFLQQMFSAAMYWG